MKNNRKLRKKFLIKPRFQLGYLFVTLSACMISVCVFAALSINLAFTISDVIVPLLNHAQLAVFKPIYVEALTSTICVTMIIMGLIILFVIYYSHRFAGPVFRIEQDLMKMTEEKKTFEIRTRKQDYLHELVDVINNFISRICFKEDKL